MAPLNQAIFVLTSHLTSHEDQSIQMCLRDRSVCVIEAELSKTNPLIYICFMDLTLETKFLILLTISNSHKAPKTSGKLYDLM